MNPEQFSHRVLEWFDAHGRKQLPWQEQPTPYRVWVSEIMLQQTQVATVIPYYRRFIERFPDVHALAEASLEEVLRLWAGLGYYARARHLHRAAQIVRDQYGGRMPTRLADVEALPGIGRSTAGAILALAMKQRQPILDGNIKRLLARFAAVEGWPGHTLVLARLWALAEYYTPSERVADYTQAMMDLGALVCTVRRPWCASCPLVSGCRAHAQNREMDFPAPKPRRTLPVRSIRMMLLRSAGRILLERRPPTGIWGGLWSFPECPLEVDVAAWCREQFGLEVTGYRSWAVMRHTFSHFHLDMTPTLVTATEAGRAIMEGERFVWYNSQQAIQLGMAAPVRSLLMALTDDLFTDENQR